MRAPISLVIPTLNAEAGLPRCLAALTEGLHEGLIRELIVTDGGSDDATLDVADAAGAVIVTGPPSRGGQLRRGAEAARGDWLLVIDPDTVLAPGWTRPVHEAIRQGGAWHFRLRYDAKGPWARLAAGWATLRARAFGLPYGEQGLLVSTQDYASAGGFPDIPQRAEGALVRALGRVQALEAVAVTSAERYRQNGGPWRGLRTFMKAARHRGEADPERVAHPPRR